MRIKQEDLAAFITATLVSVRAGVNAARAQGLIAEMPDKVDFTNIEVIHEENGLENVVTTEVEGTSTKAGTKPVIVETTAKTGGGAIATESGHDLTTRDLTKNTKDEKDLESSEEGESEDGTLESSLVTTDSQRDTTQSDESTVNSSHDNSNRTDALSGERTVNRYNE